MMLMARMARTSSSDEKYRVLELINKLSSEDRGFALVQKSRTMGYLNNPAEALEAAQQAIQECQRNDDQSILLSAYVSEINAYSRLGSEDVWKSIQKGEELIDKMSIETRNQSAAHETHFLLVKGNQFLQGGDFNKAIETMNASAEVGKTIPEGTSYSARWYWCYSNLSEIYLDLGKLEKAHECLKMYLDGRENDLHDVVHAYPTANRSIQYFRDLKIIDLYN